MKRAANFYVRLKLNITGDYYIETGVSMLHSRLEKYVSIGPNCNIVWSEIGKYTYLGGNTELPYCRIGRYCSIAPHVYLAAGLHPLHYVSTHPVLYGEEGYYRFRGGYRNAPKTGFKEFSYLEGSNKLLCEIGNDVWIAANVTLVCGKNPLHIGNGAVVAAGAVVTKDVPDYAIVMGVPAKVVGYRFEPEIRQKLSKSCWWDKDIDWINERMEKFADPIEFVKN